MNPQDPSQPFSEHVAGPEVEDEGPPVLGTWARVYRFVLAYLAALIFLAWLFTEHFKP